MMNKGLFSRCVRGFLVLLFLIICSKTYAEIQENGKEPLKEAQNHAEKWGVNVLAIRESAGGYMLDFRYRVIDPDKAAPLFDRKIKPYLIDQATGAKCMVPESPKIGALRQTRKPIVDRNYFIIFANPGKMIKKGNKVTVVIGEFKAESLIVQ
jgi:hypothetical protein